MSRIAIVGAGPGGAVLAYLLARRGVDVILFERQRDFAREFRGELLLPGGLEPFEQMGLWPALDAVPHVELDAIQVYVNRKLRLGGSFGPTFFGQFTPRWITQPALLEMLVSECGRFDNFSFERGANVRELIDDGGRVTGVRLADGTETCADLVVGADGRTSIVRRRSGVAVRADKTPMDVVWFKLPLPEFMASDPHFRVYFGHGHLLIAAPIPDGHLQIAWIIAKGSYGELRARGMPDCIDQMAEHVSTDFANHLQRFREQSLDTFLLSTVSDRVETWCKPGMLLIGDAAHTMSPVGAQGLNIAIRDAVVAANHLVPAIERRADASTLDAVARAIEAERLPEVSLVQRVQALPPRVFLRNTWWSRSIMAVLPSLLRLRLPGSERVPRRILFGATDVTLTV